MFLRFQLYDEEEFEKEVLSEIKQDFKAHKPNQPTKKLAVEEKVELTQSIHRTPLPK
jgi:hypothetical protein